MEKTEHDLIVAGAGPAGSACSITAARAGMKVLLLDKDVFPRQKVCGEFVSPESLRLLEWLLGGEQFRRQPEINRARIFSGRTVIGLPISPPARSIPRFHLDAALLNAARNAGAEVLENVTIRDVQQGATFRVTSDDQTHVARAVVNATGRWSQLTPHAVDKDSTKWIGIKGHFQEANPSPSVDLYFFDGGYCGVQPVGADTVNACAMIHADAARSFAEVFSLQQELCRRSRDWKPVFPAITTSPLYFRAPQTESRGMLLAGDAAAFIDPFAGDGISLALHSGTLAAESLQPFFQGKCGLEQAAEKYHRVYMEQFAPAFRNATRIRMLLSTPRPIRSMLVRLAGFKPFARALVSRTRTKGRGV